MLTLWIIAAVLSQTGDEPTIKETAITITPTKVDAPSLKYRLLPEARELQSGNAAVRYLRALSWEQQQTLRKPINEHDEELQKLSLDQLKSHAILKERPAINRVCELLAQAARSEYCDWDMLRRLRKDGIATTLDDMQDMRQLVRIVSLQTRIQLMEKNYPAASRELQTGLAMGQHMSKDAATAIQYLIGVAATNVMLMRVQEWIAQPSSPSLYWPLTALPHPIGNVERAIESERIWVDHLCPGIRDALADPTKVPPPIDWKKIADAMSSEWGKINPVLLTVLLASEQAEARDYLLRAGHTPEQIEALPATTLSVMYEVHLLDKHLDGYLQRMTSPPPIALPGLKQAQADFERETRVAGPLTPGYMARLFLPAIMQVYRAAYRAEHRISVLRTIEALRLHAGQTGSLPETLAEVKIVPIPHDPYTDRPIDYHYDAAARRATLRLSPPPGESPNEWNAMKFVITLQK